MLMSALIFWLWDYFLQILVLSKVLVSLEINSSQQDSFMCVILPESK